MKTIFWNVDTQYDFMRADGKLPVPGAEDIEPNLERLTSYARKNNIQVVNTADWHHDDSKEFSDEPDYKTTFPSHCLKNTKGAKYVPATTPNNTYVVDWGEDLDDKALADHEGDIVIYKDAFDVFAGNPHTGSILGTLKPNLAIVYGVATNVCVNYAVMGLLERGVEVYVPTDAIKELPGIPLEETLKGWEKQGAKLTTVEGIVDFLEVKR